MSFIHQVFEIIQRAIGGVDAVIIGDIVAVILQRGGVDGQQPDAVHPQVLEVIQLLGQAGQVAVPIAVAVAKGAHVDFVKNRVFIPHVLSLKERPAWGGNWISDTPCPLGIPLSSGYYPLTDASHQAAHKVALQGKEDRQRQDHADERAGGQQVPVLAFFADDGGQRAGDHPVLVTQEDQGHQVVVPDPQELEDGKGGQRRDGKRQDQLGEDGEVGSAIDEGRFQNIARQLR